jgi:hypothetical protein
MSNYDLTTGTSDKLYQKHDQSHAQLVKTLDFSLFTGSAAGAAADTADIITIPAGFVVEDVFTVSDTASTTSSSVFGVGDDADSAYYLPNTTSATATAGTVVKTGTGASGKFKDGTSVASYSAATCKYYTTASTLRVLLGATAPLNGKVKFIVRGFWAL